MQASSRSLRSRVGMTMETSGSGSGNGWRRRRKPCGSGPSTVAPASDGRRATKSSTGCTPRAARQIEHARLGRHRRIAADMHQDAGTMQRIAAGGQDHLQAPAHRSPSSSSTAAGKVQACKRGLLEEDRAPEAVLAQEQVVAEIRLEPGRKAAAAGVDLVFVAEDDRRIGHRFDRRASRCERRLRQGDRKDAARRRSRVAAPSDPASAVLALPSLSVDRQR